MTIQELIDELSKIKDKTKQIYYRDSRPDHPFGDKRNIEIKVEGNVGSINTTSGDVTINGDANSINTASGDVDCHEVKGSVHTMSGDVTCGDIAGSVSTMSGDVYQK